MKSDRAPMLERLADGTPRNTYRRKRHGRGEWITHAHHQPVRVASTLVLIAILVAGLCKYLGVGA